MTILFWILRAFFEKTYSDKQNAPMYVSIENVLQIILWAIITEILSKTKAQNWEKLKRQIWNIRQLNKPENSFDYSIFFVNTREKSFAPKI